MNRINKEDAIRQIKAFVLEGETDPAVESVVQTMGLYTFSVRNLNRPGYTPYCTVFSHRINETVCSELNPLVWLEDEMRLALQSLPVSDALTAEFRGTA